MTAVSQSLSVIEPCNWPQNAALAVFAVASGVKDPNYCYHILGSSKFGPNM